MSVLEELREQIRLAEVRDAQQTMGRRTALAWLTAHRRLTRDHERDPEISEELIRWAAINHMLRPIARGEPAERQQCRSV